MNLEDIPGVRIRNWNENRQRKDTASSIFTLGWPAADASQPCWVQFRYEPGWRAPAHAHSGWSCTVVLEGSWIAGGVEYGPGEMIIVAPNVTYGPFDPGPNGVLCVEFFENQAALPPIWDDNDPDVKTQLERLGADAASIYDQQYG
jgi:hypothetical protein